MKARRMRLNHDRNHRRARNDRSCLLNQTARLAFVWLRGTDVVFSDVADSKCCKWLFAETELKNNNHSQVRLLPLVLRCYPASI